MGGWSSEGDLFGAIAAGRFNVLGAMHGWRRRVDENGELGTHPFLEPPIRSVGTRSA
jgi:hypothetical protein